MKGRKEEKKGGGGVGGGEGGFIEKGKIIGARELAGCKGNGL